ncbi:pyridoxamine phosphate oxidase family protein [Rhodotorula toruloides NP11]|uniref:Pyridoxamine phosphate oxidase family protein n=1 Tax=Rhodotorula toruloides (strain NP11) TaxID=1130832 RepID=M7WGE2_RHOT1|nr:pyridoxamine phosphate oxidase family protein [Rhodotorula toruloides NP11]EMS19502.1 pyridoxamine phosphate oxidase family protein [Rhodotorula toruloides NP11]
MGAFYDEIPESLIPWIKKSSGSLRRHCQQQEQSTSLPKARYDCFTIDSPTAVWYVDMTGSGNETISHMREPGNGRLTILFNAFEGPPRILRLYGHATIHPRDTPQFNALLPPDDPRRLPGARAVVWMEVERVGTSCGYSVPFFEFVGERPRLKDYFTPFEHLPSPSPSLSSFPLTPTPKLQSYWALKNSESVDGLPGLEAAGYPPNEGAIRKARKGVSVAYGAEAVRERERKGWSEHRVGVAVVLGLVVGWCAGQGGHEWVREEVSALVRQVARAVGSPVA